MFRVSRCRLYSVVVATPGPTHHSLEPEDSSFICILREYGLANRLRALAASFILAKETNRTFFLNWVPSAELNASFEDLFYLPPNVHAREVTVNAEGHPAESGGAHRRHTVFDAHRIPLPPALTFESHTWQPDVTQILANQGVDVVAVESGADFRIPDMPCETYFRRKAAFYRTLIPVPAVRIPVDTFYREHMEGHTVIGLHIRRATSLAFDYPHVPGEDGIMLNSSAAVALMEFEEHVVAMISHYQHQRQNGGKTGATVKFFLCTNDQETEAYMLRKYPEHMIVYPKAHHSERDSVVGIREALADWLLLGGCALVVGSFWSSFSDEATVMNGTFPSFLPSVRPSFLPPAAPCSFLPSSSFFPLIYIYAPTLSQTHICIHTHTHIYICVCVYIYACVCVGMCM